jgi:hypothetical protein
VADLVRSSRMSHQPLPGSRASSSTPTHTGTTSAVPISMASPVTRHALKPETPAGPCLLAGVDTLDLGVYVRWDSQWEFHVRRLETWRCRAAGTPGVFIDDGALPVGMAVILPGGKQNYRFHLQFPEFHLFLSKADGYRNSPNVYVSLNAKTMWSLGISAAVSLVRGVIEDLGGSVDLLQPSRVDLCADFAMPGGFDLNFLRTHRMGRSRATIHYEKGNRLETFYVGVRKAPLSARIYDKGLEILESKKEWFLPLWQKADGKDVWRVEFQFRRSMLKSFHIDDIDALHTKMAGLWHMATTRWVGFRKHDNARPMRRSYLPWWQGVIACAEKFGKPVPLERFPHTLTGSAEWYEKHIIGCLSTYGAIKKMPNLPTTVVSFIEMLQDKVDPKDFRERIALKSIKLGHFPTPEQTPDETKPSSTAEET